MQIRKNTQLSNHTKFAIIYGVNFNNYIRASGVTRTKRGFFGRKAAKINYNDCKQKSNVFCLHKSNSIFAGVAQLFRALPCQGRGRELESLHPHQRKNVPLGRFFFDMAEIDSNSRPLQKIIIVESCSHLCPCPTRSRVRKSSGLSQGNFLLKTCFLKMKFRVRGTWMSLFTRTKSRTPRKWGF